MECELFKQGIEQGSCQVFDLRRERIDAYNAAKDAGLRKIRLGNLHLVVHTREEYETVEKIAGRESL